MPRKSIREARQNLDDATTYIPERYESGIQGAEWQAKATSDKAENNFKSAMQKVISEGLRLAGLRDVSDAEWRNAAVNKGRPIIGDRISGALDKYAEQFGPVLEAMNSKAEEVEGERTLDPMANIDNVLKPVVQAAIEASKR